MDYQTVVAIDGPGGSGKSTISKSLANKLKFLYVDTGAMYRSLAYYLNKNNVPFEEGNALHSCLESLVLTYHGEKEYLVTINGENITGEIRKHFVSDLASRLSSLVSVRNYLLEVQRCLAKDQVCVMEGRDIGSVIFPNAFCKIYLTASPEVRAQRRLHQLNAMGQMVYSYDAVLNDILQRDLRDSERKIAPLVRVPDAISVDTSGLNESEVLDKIQDIVLKRAQICNIRL